jgi:hypothetical protein
MSRFIRVTILTKAVVAFLLCFLTDGVAIAAEAKYSPLPYPRLDSSSWVMIEFWPDVSDITLSAYFLDFSYERNRNLCTAAKAIFDQDKKERSKTSKREFSSYRLCFSLNDAVQQGHVEFAR